MQIRYPEVKTKQIFWRALYAVLGVLPPAGLVCSSWRNLPQRSQIYRAEGSQRAVSVFPAAKRSDSRCQPIRDDVPPMIESFLQHSPWLSIAPRGTGKKPNVDEASAYFSYVFGARLELVRATVTCRRIGVSESSPRSHPELSAVQKIFGALHHFLWTSPNKFLIDKARLGIKLQTPGGRCGEGHGECSRYGVRPTTTRPQSKH